jgi:hypothetical protein
MYIYVYTCIYMYIYVLYVIYILYDIRYIYVSCKKKNLTSFFKTSKLLDTTNLTCMMELHTKNTVCIIIYIL